MTSSTGSPRNMSPLSINSDETYCSSPGFLLAALGNFVLKLVLPLVLHGGAKVTPSFVRKPSAAYYWQL